jgi:hypothetical protein
MLYFRLSYLVPIVYPVSSNATSPKALFPSPTSFPSLLLFTQFALQCSKNLISHYTLLVTTRSTKVSCVFKQSRRSQITSVLCPLPFDLCATTFDSSTSLFSSPFPRVDSLLSSLSPSCSFSSTLPPHIHRARASIHAHNARTHARSALAVCDRHLQCVLPLHACELLGSLPMFLQGAGPCTRYLVVRCQSSSESCVCVDVLWASLDGYWPSRAAHTARNNFVHRGGEACSLLPI